MSGGGGFFGDLSGGGALLELGALEEGRDAPPAEELLSAGGHGGEAPDLGLLGLLGQTGAAPPPGPPPPAVDAHGLPQLVPFFGAAAAPGPAAGRGAMPWAMPPAMPPAPTPPVEPAPAAEPAAAATGGGADPREALVRVLTTQRKGALMSRREVENIMRIQYASAHAGDQYVEDYYYREVFDKCAGQVQNVPQGLRAVDPNTRIADKAAGHVDLTGLGAVPVMNIRRPRPIMDVGAGERGSKGSSLEESPWLAAKVLVEDGMCLMLDVDDIDKLLLVRFEPHSDEYVVLSSRRESLLDSLCTSLFLPTAAAQDAKVEEAVILCILLLSKGRKLLARLLRALPAGHPACEAMAKIVCSNLNQVFAADGQMDGDRLLAQSLVHTLSGLGFPSICAHTQLVVDGVTSQRLAAECLDRAGAQDGEATTIVAGLIRRAGQLLGEGAGAAADRERWGALVERLHDVLLRSLSEIKAGFTERRGRGAVPPGASCPVPMEVLKTFIPVASPVQQQALKQVLMALTQL